MPSSAVHRVPLRPWLALLRSIADAPHGAHLAHCHTHHGGKLRRVPPVGIAAASRRRGRRAWRARVRGAWRVGGRTEA